MPALLNLVFDATRCRVVEFVRVEPELHAGEAFALDELQVGVGVGAQDAELRLPVRRRFALRLRGSWLRRLP